MSEELKKSDLESRAPSAVSFVPTPDDKIFTEISEKVLKSRLNTKNKNSECFVDKGRQMSVMMGNKDLYTNLKLQEKKKSFLGKVQDRLEGEAIYFKERGVYLMNSGQTGAAITSFTRALVTSDQDMRCWILRSSCYIRLNQMDKAIKDADSALKINPKSTRALSTKAEALYCQGSFEKAMVLFTRCSVQSKTDDIVRGINKSRAAIISTLKSVDYPADIDTIIMKILENKCNVKTGSRKKMSKNYLGLEKYFLSSLNNVPRLKGEERNYPCKFGSKLMLKEDIIMEIAREGLEYIQKRENFWSEMGSMKNPQE